MNREVRRRIKKSNVPPELVKEIINEGRNEAISIYGVAVAMVCRDKLEFGAKRTNKFLVDVCELFDSMVGGFVSVEDCQKVIEEELGIKF